MFESQADGGTVGSRRAKFMTALSTFHDTFGQYDPSEQVRSFDCQAPAARAAADRARQAPLRLTRRGRFVFFGLPLIMLAALILSFSGFFNSPAKAAESGSELSLTPTVSVTVQPGESLWAIAGAVAPERDPRDVV